MKRLAIAAVLASGTFGAAGAAQAQQVCCVPPPPQMRGPMPAPVYQPPPPPYAGQPQGYAPYPEAPPPSGGLRGYVGVQYSETRADPGTPSPRSEGWTGEGYVSTTAYGLGVQGDIKATRYSGPGGEEWTVAPTGHVYRRNASNLVGAFLGFSNTEGDDLIGGGVEAQAYLRNATLYGSLGYGHINGTSDTDVWTARVEGRYFFNENLRADASVAYSRLSTPTTRGSAWTYGIGAEYQLGSAPLAINAGYQHVNAEDSPAETNTLRLGLRWALTGDTLLGRDRVGPSLGNVRDLFANY